jgi:hypothetical protein
MPSSRFVLAAALVLAAPLPAIAYMHARRGPTSSSLFKKRSSTRSSKPSGPRAIDSERATEIQAALIRTGYLTGTPSGHWDAQSQAAMQKLQGSNGWQTKLTPDSRALIFLGLGPKTGTQESQTQDLQHAELSSQTSSPATSGFRAAATFTGRP